MDSLEQLFDAARSFYGAEPSVDASAAVCFMFGTHAFQDIVDETRGADAGFRKGPQADAKRPAQPDLNQGLHKLIRAEQHVGGGIH